MKDEILLGTGFYYDGVPQTGRYVTTENNDDCIEYASDTIGAASSINARIGACLTIFQMIAVVLSIICICKGILNIRRNRKKNSNFNNELSGENIEKNEQEDNPIIDKKRGTIRYFVIAIILWWISSIIQMSKNFAVKPIIYIYPEEEKKVKVKVKNPERLTCTYPKYDDKWEVLAKANGDLIDLKTNRRFYALYWEGINIVKANLKEGFIVKGEDSAKFLEEKLEILGLNEREAEEFIVYWLPLMEKNKYNYIRFETMEEIDENMELEITPVPETLIRINMQFKGLRKPIDIEEQKLKKVERKGYTVVEWGGTKL